MINYEDHPVDEVLERYLDDQLSAVERETFESRLDDDVELRSQVDAHHRLVDCLQQTFQPSVPSVADLEHLLNQATDPGSPSPWDTDAPLESSLEDENIGLVLAPMPSATRRRRAMLMAIIGGLAALLAWLFVAPQYRGNRSVAPFFQQRPLTELYRETVDQGFRPYYFCEDQDRFARTFLKRQRTPLVLAQLPPDRRMVGLSYPGGLSRNTTAMLGYVEEKPVIVFVDRAVHDNEGVATTQGDEPLFVHRAILGDLVLYEVTPFDEPKMTPYLQVQRSANEAAP